MIVSFLSVLQNIWSLQTQCFHLYGGSLDSIGYLLVVKLWPVMLHIFTGLSEVFFFLSLYLNYLLAAFYIVVFICNCIVFILQALYNFSGIRCVLRRILRCSGMYCWHCCLLLFAMYYCNFICSSRSGILPWWSMSDLLVGYHNMLWSLHSSQLSYDKMMRHNFWRRFLREWTWFVHLECEWKCTCN